MRKIFIIHLYHSLFRPYSWHFWCNWQAISKAIIMLVYQGSEWVLAKKSEKCVIPSSVGNGRKLLKELWTVCSPAGGSGGRGPQVVHSNAFLGSIFPNTHTPTSLKKILLRFTLISKMVLGVGKKSEIRLKSEDSVPCVCVEYMYW